MTVSMPSFVHRYEPATRLGMPPILLLHGTGGDENDLIPLGRLIAPGAALLSPRGKVLEAGMPRFFRRLSEGVFDEADVRRQANDLADFIVWARRTYDLDRPVAVGFSNGANLAAAVLFLRPEALRGAVLLRAMVPLTDLPSADLNGKRVLLLSGASDPIVPPDNAQRLAAMLTASGAALQHLALPVGHGLSQSDVDIAHAWINPP